MKSNQKNTDIYQDNIYKNENLISSKTKKNPNYLYPSGYRITHPMRWFKG